jgi:amidophosphoribosyltransferase
LEDLEHSVSQFNPALKNFDMSVFNGCYVTGDVTQTYLKQLENKRNDSAKDEDKEKLLDTDVIGLHNRLNDK